MSHVFDVVLGELCKDNYVVTVIGVIFKSKFLSIKWFMKKRVLEAIMLRLRRSFEVYRYDVLVSGLFYSITALKKFIKRKCNGMFLLEFSSSV